MQPENDMHIDPASSSKELLAMVIHDLRSPLRSIEAAASLLLEFDVTHEASARAKEGILASSKSIRKVFDAVRIYLEERREIARKDSGVNPEAAHSGEELLAMVLHDLIHPLGLLEGYAGLLNEDLKEEDPKIVEKVQKSAHGMREMIDNI